MKVLIVDDEETLLETVEMKMRRDGYSTFTATTAEEAMKLFRKVRPDIILLDIMLPKRSGFELCRAIRKDSQVPIIFLTARAEEDDRVQGLEMGADDYVVKPFNLAELGARVKAVLRRSSGEPILERIEIGNLDIDPRTHQAKIDGELIPLTPKEFALLLFFARSPGHVFSREVLLDRVWGRDAYVTARTVDVHVRWLRTRIEPNPDKPERIVTVRGVGYKFVG